MTQNGHYEGAAIPENGLAGDGRNILSVEKLTKYLHRLGRKVKITTKKSRELEVV